MSDLRINCKIFFLIFLFILYAYLYSENISEKRLEKNIDRIRIENFFLQTLDYDNNVVPFIAVYCFNSYYLVYDTGLDYNKIGGQRYFFDYKVDKKISNISLYITDKNLSLEDFINKYLVKYNDGSYRINYRGYDIFTPKDKFLLPILLAAQYNYDFLIIVEHGYSPVVKLYLPNAYKNAINEYNIQLSP